MLAGAAVVVLLVVLVVLAGAAVVVGAAVVEGVVVLVTGTVVAGAVVLTTGPVVVVPVGQPPAGAGMMSPSWSSCPSSAPAVDTSTVTYVPFPVMWHSVIGVNGC